MLPRRVNSHAGPMCVNVDFCIFRHIWAKQIKYGNNCPTSISGVFVGRLPYLAQNISGFGSSEVVDRLSKWYISIPPDRGSIFAEQTTFVSVHVTKRLRKVKPWFMDPLVNSEININRYITISHMVCLRQMLNSSEFHGLYKVWLLSIKSQSFTLHTKNYRNMGVQPELCQIQIFFGFSLQAGKRHLRPSGGAKIMSIFWKLRGSPGIQPTNVGGHILPGAMVGRLGMNSSQGFTLSKQEGL